MYKAQKFNTLLQREEILDFLQRTIKLTDLLGCSLSESLEQFERRMELGTSFKDKASVLFTAFNLLRSYVEQLV